MKSIILVGFGAFLIFVGIVGMIAVLSFPTYPFDAFGGNFQLTEILFSLMPAVLGVILVVIGAWPGKPIEFRVPTGQSTVVQEVVKVKIRCPYCGNLYDETLDKCPNCGAKR